MYNEIYRRTLKIKATIFKKLFIFSNSVKYNCLKY